MCRFPCLTKVVQSSRSESIIWGCYEYCLSYAISIGTIERGFNFYLHIPPLSGWAWEWGSSYIDCNLHIIRSVALGPSWPLYSAYRSVWIFPSIFDTSNHKPKGVCRMKQLKHWPISRRSFNNGLYGIPGVDVMLPFNTITICCHTPLSRSQAWNRKQIALFSTSRFFHTFFLLFFFSWSIYASVGLI